MANAPINQSRPAHISHYDWPRHLCPASRQTLTFTGLGKMAPLRVTMTDLDGTRLRPEPPRPAEKSPSFFKLGPLRKAPYRADANTSQRAAPDAIPAPGPQRLAPATPSDRTLPKPREAFGADERPSLTVAPCASFPLRWEGGLCPAGLAS